MALRNRWLAELALFLALATLHTWPLARDPAHLTRLDNDDTALNTWIVAWVAHQLPRDPLELFNAPIFFPSRHTLAFSEHMVVPSLLGAPLLWSGASPVLVYNILVWLGLALSGFAMCVVMRHWTGSRVAGIVSGCLYAFNAHLLTRYPHLQALHVQFLPIVLYAFNRMLRDPGPRSALLLTGAFVLQALCSNYTLVLMTGALVAALVVRAEPWRRRSMRLWGTLVAAGAGVVFLMLPFLWPYYLVRTEQGLARTLDEVRLYSAGWLDYLVTGGRLHYDAWSHRFFEGRTALFPGIVGAGLAVSTVVSGTAWRDSRARMALAFGLMGFALSFGAGLPGYGFLHEHLLLLQGLRNAARWGFLVLVAVAVLAGFAVLQLESRWKHRSWWPAAAVALVGLVTLEALRAPLPMVRFDGIPGVHARLNDDTVRAVAVFPLFGLAQFNLNAGYMLDQTRHWRPMVNGYSGWAPASFDRHAARLILFPDDTALEELRTLGVSHVIVHRAAFVHRVGAEALNRLRSHPALEFLFEEDGVVAYRVKGQ